MADKPVDFIREGSKVCVTVEDEELTLKELAFYIGFQETRINEQALIYDSAKPTAWWNTHTNGKFLRIEARDFAVDMLIHDHYYAKAARQKGLALSEEDKTMAGYAATDYWDDLSERGHSVLGITAEDAYNTCLDVILAEKYMNLLSEESGRDRAVYETGGSAWEAEKESLKIKYNETLLDRIQMGEITIN